MSEFTVRVELHDATWENYLDLHKKMASKGFTTTVTDMNGGVAKMPMAEYNISSNSTMVQIRDLANLIAKSVVSKCAILVTQSAGRCWIGLAKA